MKTITSRWAASAALSALSVISAQLLVSSNALAQAPSWPLPPSLTQGQNQNNQANPAVQQQQQQPSAAHGPAIPSAHAYPGQQGAVMPAGANIAGYTLGEWTGKPVRGATQEELGQVGDFLIDPQNGRVAFAIVPSGAGQQGETYRLLPMEALDVTSGTEGLRINLNQGQWRQVGTLNADRVQGRVTLNNDLRTRMQQQFGLSQPVAGEEGNVLVRASQLRGKPLQSGNQAIASINDIVVDVQHRYAVAVVNAQTTGALGIQQQLVPFQHLQVSDDLNTVSTSLTAAHFQQNQAGLPTGLPGAGPFSGGTAPGLGSAIAVRQALDQDASVAQANVRVVPETRVALFGTVATQELRSNIERIAKEAAPGVPILNHITVQGNR